MLNTKAKYGLQKNEGPDKWSFVQSGFFNSTREMADAIGFSPAKMGLIASTVGPGSPNTFKTPDGTMYRLHDLRER